MKKFIVLGNKNSVTHKSLFIYFMKKEIRMGFSIPDNFLTPSGLSSKLKGLCRWYSNLKIDSGKELRLTKEYNPEDYPVYDNYNAINCDKIRDIPYDYSGMIGVPVTILEYDLKDYEVIGIADRQNTYGLRTKKYGPEDDEKYNDMNPNAVIKIDGEYISKYSRVFIKKI